MKGCIIKYQSILGIPLPIIPVTFINDDKYMSVDTYIDTGASYSILSFEDAIDLDIDTKSGAQKYVVNGGGNIIELFIHTIEVEIGTYRITAEIGFSEQLKVGYKILGRKGIFEKLIFCFNDTRQAIHIMSEKEVDEWK
jgi:predicted aspartyl protease